MAQSTEDTDVLLTRLSRKGGVQSTLVLERETGAIVRSSGLITSPVSDSRPSRPERPVSNGDGTVEISGSADSEAQVVTRAEEVAGMVWSFVGAAGGLIRGLNEEDDLKLLRLRTKKNEIVIVPGRVFSV
ncbi:MAG: hypothetical protein M1815_001088 [Lichina confinis]|nr:MAG: hypothetical protein M1815_001088 [Lichina confinis]